MKRNFTLFSIVLAAAVVASANNYTTPGNCSVLTFDALSDIEESGVIKMDENVYILNDSITVAATDTLRLDNNATLQLNDLVCITVNGVADFCPADTANIENLNETDDLPLGLMVFDDETEGTAYGKFKNITFNGTGIAYGCTKGLHVDNCTFTNVKQPSQGAISYFRTGAENIVENSTFVGNPVPAIAAGANCYVGVIFRNNYLYDNNSINNNRPFISLTVAGENNVEIIGNTIVGAKRNMVGGIAVANLLGYKGTNKVIIKGNHVSDCRYGANTTGPNINAEYIDNIFINNKYESNAMNGGSGINVFDPYYTQNAIIKGNYIEGSLWGITVIGCNNVNIGKTNDPNAEDYNPGNNVFKDNGNGGVLYDLYNNSSNLIYAQGNTWNVDEQTREKIETVIFHQADNEKLGKVVFMPGETGVSTIATDNNSVRYDTASKSLILANIADKITVYSANGSVVASASATDNVSVNTLSRGIYIARIVNGTNTTTLKFSVK